MMAIKTLSWEGGISLHVGYDANFGMEWPIIYWTGNTGWGVSSRDTSSTRLAELAYSSWLDQYHLAFERRFQSVFEVLLGNTTWPFRRFAIEDLLWNTSILHSDRWPDHLSWYSLHGNFVVIVVVDVPWSFWFILLPREVNLTFESFAF